MGNFEVFTRTWAEHYISFEPRHVDWDKVVAEARAKIGVGTTPGQLFEGILASRSNWMSLTASSK